MNHTLSCLKVLNPPALFSDCSCNDRSTNLRQQYVRLMLKTTWDWKRFNWKIFGFLPWRKSNKPIKHTLSVLQKKNSTQILFIECQISTKTIFQTLHELLLSTGLDQTFPHEQHTVSREDKTESSIRTRQDDKKLKVLMTLITIKSGVILISCPAETSRNRICIPGRCLWWSVVYILEPFFQIFLGPLNMT